MSGQLFHPGRRKLLLGLALVGVVSALAHLCFRNLIGTGFQHRSDASAVMTPILIPSALRGDAAITHLKEQGLYSSLGEAVTGARYSAHPLRSGKAFEVINPEHGLHATFDAEDAGGTRIVASRNKQQRELAINLTGYGYDQRLIALSSQRVNAEQNRVEYTHYPDSASNDPQSAIKEWFVNNPDGIEHGFVLPAAPNIERPRNAALRVVMEVGGDFRAHVSAGSQAVSMVDQTGATELRYDKLRVYDANGRDLAAHFELDGNRLAIVVEDRSAVYPVTIDPLLAQSTRLTAGDGAAEDYFGAALAISGNTAIVGAPRNDISADADQGAAYVFIRSGGTWTQQDKLKAPLGTVGDFFGGSVAISGDTVIVGAYLDDTVANVNQGAAYVFTRSAGVWTQQDKLQADDGEANDLFGFSVAIDGDTVIIGAHLNDTGANANQGAAYVFTRSGGTWSQQQKLTASDPGGGDFFGISIALDGGTSVIGASGKIERGDAGAGAAYIFTLSGGTWTEQQKLLPDVSAPDNFFGAAAALSGDTALIGSFGDDIGANADQGSAVVFVRSGSTWTKQARLTADDGSADDKFGLSVALNGDTAVIGATGDDLNGADQGSACVFSRTDTTWSEQPRLFDTIGGKDDKFGAPVGISGDTILIGASFDDIDGNSNQGSASVFVISQGLAEQQKITAADADEYDHFGESVAISGDTVVVGVPSDPRGGNPSQGSAYVFVRSGSIWTQQQRLNAADGAAFDRFGFSVAISGDTAVVGAWYADIDGTLDQGAAYIFVRNGDAWTQQEKLTAADGSASDFFGFSVAISGDTVVVGVSSDDIGGNGSQGSAYVFVRNVATWSQQQKLTAADGEEFDSFGHSVTISGDTLVVGSMFDRVGGDFGQGSAYVFVRSGGSWSQQQKLTVADGEADDHFGASVGISGGTVVVGADSDEVYGNAYQGSAYVFVRSDTTWRLQAQLIAANGSAGDQFGLSVAISADRLVVGSSSDEIEGNISQGSAYVFVRNGSTWSQERKLTAEDGAEGDNFGIAVAISGDTVVAGAEADAIDGKVYQGSAYIFGGAACPAVTLDPTLLTNGTAGSSYDQRIRASSGSGPYNYSVSSGTLPSGLTLDPTTGLLSGRPMLAGSYDFTITATDGGLCPGSQDYTLVIDCPIISVRPANPNLTPGQVGAPYNRVFTANGGLAPHTFSIVNGALPGGLALDAATGVLSGTPSTSGTFSFAIRTNDSSGCSGSSGYVLTVNCPTIRVSPTSPNLPPGAAGSFFTGTFTATGGVATFDFSITSGALPTGLTFDEVTGVLSGTPTVTGTFNFAVRGADSFGCFGSRASVLTINCPTISVEPANPVLPNGAAGTPYNQTFSATGGVGSLTFGVVAGALPGGLVLDAATGVLSGTPTSRNTFIFVIRATDSNGCIGRRQYRIVVN
jgi:hypothetical protein